VPGCQADPHLVAVVYLEGSFLGVFIKEIQEHSCFNLPTPNMMQHQSLKRDAEETIV